MSIFDAMYAGASGLDAESGALGVIGNNVANENTIGFKESRAIFENVMGSAVGSAQIGGGVEMSSTQQIFAQGSLETTDNPTDVALQGNGFFVVQGSVGGTSGDFYTRAGQTSLNANGTLVNPDGLALQGYQALPNGQMSSQLGSITLSSAAIPPVATTSMTVAANLNANATPPSAPFDPQNPAATSNGSTSFQVYDSLGNAHTVNVYLCNTGPGQWTYHELASGSEVSGGTPGQNVEIGSGQLSFDSNGDLSNVTPTGGSVTFNGASAQTIAFNVGTPTSSGGTGRDGLTQNGGTAGASDVAVSAQSQNGYASGDLSGIQIGADGTVSGQYTNGQTLAVGQLAVASFQSNNGLSSVGQNLWAATQQSGSAALGTAGSGGRGAIQSGALEESNVDIATQFVDLIAHQQGYEANSKTITTVDQMLSTLQNMIS